MEKFGKTIKKIYINESQLSVLSDELNKEVTFYEFFVNTKTFLKDLLNKPFLTIGGQFCAYYLVFKALLLPL